jgi:hypothetical protein
MNPRLWGALGFCRPSAARIGSRRWPPDRQLNTTATTVIKLGIFPPKPSRNGVSVNLSDHAEITMTGATSIARLAMTSGRIGAKMTAELIIFDLNRSSENDSTDENDRLFSALQQYTSAELLELLYVGQEPGFFELIRGLFALSDESRLALQNFLATAAHRGTTAAIDPAGRFILQPRTFK